MLNKKFIGSMMIAGSLVFASCNESPKSEGDMSDATAASEGDAKYMVEPAGSSVRWSGEMLGIKEHNGSVALKSGSIDMKNGQISGGTFTIDMNTITPLDANYQPEQGYSKEKLVGHLSSPDFFDVATHPEASFTITSVSGNMAKGNLTVRGKTNEETIKDIVIAPEGDKMKITGNIVFDRKKYDVAFMMPTTDMIISDDVKVNVELIAAK